MENFDYAFRAVIKNAKSTEALDKACIARLRQAAASQAEPARSIYLSLLKILKDGLIA